MTDSDAFKTIRSRMRGDVIRRLERASQQDPITHPEALAYSAIVQAVVNYCEALDRARMIGGEDLLNPANRAIANSFMQEVSRREQEMRACVGWPI